MTIDITPQHCQKSSNGARNSRVGYNYIGFTIFATLGSDSNDLTI